jgi:hypothetical protein
MLTGPYQPLGGDASNASQVAPRSLDRDTIMEFRPGIRYAA